MKLTPAELEALTIELDTPLHRFLAAVVGGAVTLLGIGAAGIREMNRRDFLRLRSPEVVWFALATSAVGGIGGGLGHFLIVRVGKGPMERRAVRWGVPIGLLTALSCWGVTFYWKEVLSPFEPSPEVDEVIRDAAKAALVAGPLAGISVSLLVFEVLKRLLHPERSGAMVVPTQADVARRTGVPQQGRQVRRR